MTMNNQKGYPVTKTKEEWEASLSDQQYQVLREKGTERPFSGDLLHMTDEGNYICAGCKSVLFSSDDKYESGHGWPSFNKAIDDNVIKKMPDDSWGMNRIEIICSNCGGHLGHLFEDNKGDVTNAEYCINSAALEFEKK